jgi:uncharacterized membrane protein
MSVAEGPSTGPLTVAREAGEVKETGRVEAFSDGVFAIAITLLVINLLPIGGKSGDVWGQLAAAWPTFFAFVTSFFTILVIWMNHHALFTLIRRIDRNFLLLNGCLLFVTTFIPFPTALIAQHLLDPEGGGAVVAAAIYAFTGLCLAGAFTGVWRYASKDGRLLDRNAAKQSVEEASSGFWLGPVGYGSAVAVAFVSPLLSFAIVAALAVFFAVNA